MSMQKRILWIALISLGLLFLFVLGIYLRNTPPGSLPFRVCSFNNLTGFYCPSCGSTRAVHLLLQMDFTGAVRQNPFFIFILCPFGLFCVWYTARRYLFRKEIHVHWFRLLAGLLLLSILFMILRNLPFDCLDFLRPNGSY